MGALANVRDRAESATGDRETMRAYREREIIEREEIEREERGERRGERHKRRAR